MTTKTELIEATAELLWERGYAATSPALIQKRAGVGQGSMYHHFTGKADLAEAAMRHSGDLLRSASERALGTGSTAVERVSAYLDLDRDPLAGCRLGRLAQDADVVGDEALRAVPAEFFGWLEGRIAQILTEGIESGELRPATDPLATASLVVAAVQGGFVLARALGDPDALQRVTRAAKQAIRDLAA